MPDEDVQLETDGQEATTDEQGGSPEEGDGQAQTSDGQEGQEQDEGEKKLSPDADYWRKEYHKKQRQYNDLKSRSAFPQPQRQMGSENDELSKKPLDQITNVQDFYKRIMIDAKREVAQDFSETQKNERIGTTQEQARQTHDGSDGLPEYDSLVDEMVTPMIEKNPNVYYLLREMPNPAEAAYTLGLVMKYPDLSKRLRAQGREDLADKIDETTKKAVTLRGRKETQTSPKQTKEDLMRMKPDEFEREIAKVTGRIT